MALDDLQLPVFPFRVNWREGVLERLIWKTLVMQADNRNEQRQGLRRSPRREFDVTLTLFDRERAFHDLWLHRMLDKEIMFPVWHDATATTTLAERGDTEILFNARDLDFQDGGLAILFGADAFNNETIQLDAVGFDGATLAAPMLQRWPRGTKIAPLVRGFLSEEGANATRSTPRSWEFQTRLMTNQANDYSTGPDSADQYLGLPVMMQAPDGAEDTAYDFSWEVEELDNDTGLFDRLSVQGGAAAGQRITHLVQGREAKKALRQFLYRREGRLNPLWLPTFNRDLVLAKNAGLGQGYIETEQSGYRYTGGVTDGRNHIAIRTPDGTSYHEITGAQPAGSGRREKLLISPALPRALTPGGVRMISFMDTARLDADQIELNHATDADGVTQAQLPYRTFRDNRTAPTPIAYPIPNADMTPGSCGSAAPEDDPCNPSVASFDGWWLKFKVDFWPAECGPVEFPNTFLEVFTEYDEETQTYDPDSLINLIAADHQGVEGEVNNELQLAFYAGEHTVQYLEYTLWQSANIWSPFPDDVTQGDPKAYRLRLQFPPAVFTCTFARYARVSVRRWYDSEFTPYEIIPCAWGNTIPLFEGTDADVEGIWPRDYVYII